MYKCNQIKVSVHPTAASSGVFLPPMDGNAPANQLPHQVGDQHHEDEKDNDDDKDGADDHDKMTHQGPGRDERIEELVDTLECPVCLDTADTAPIYQCPEGHLVCDDCNAKMVECPQVQISTFSGLLGDISMVDKTR